ncbi:MAG: ATP-binding protein [Nodosilinea sp.]
MAQSQPTEPPFDQPLVSLSRALKALRGAQTADAAVAVAVDHLHQTLDFDLVWVGLYDRVHHRLVTQGCHSPAQMRAMRTTINLTPGDLMEQAVMQQRPLIVADLQTEIRAGEWGVIAKQLALQSAIVYPIKRQEDCLGLLVLASPRWGLSSSLEERSYLAIMTGGLAEALYHLEAEQQRRQAKRLEQPLLALLGKLGSRPDVDGQIKEVVRETQRFIDPTRTRMFWFEPQGNYFWQRVPALAPQAGSQGLQIAVEDARGLYQALCNQQLVVVGESRGALKAVVSDRLMQQLQAQALMVAPITDQADLIGFLIVEASLPRIWQEVEKQFLMGIARLLSLALPTAIRHEVAHQAELDYHLTEGIIQSIHGDVDWHQALQACFTVLQERLAIQQFFVLLFNPDRNGYDLCFQGQVGRTLAAPLLWPCLDDIDWQLLERSPVPMAIDNLRQDLKLMAWRESLLHLGAQGVLVGSASPGHAPEGIVMIIDRANRQWTSTEQGLFAAVGRQIGVILHQWQLQRQIDQQQHTYEAIQWGLQALHQGQHTDQLEQTTLQYMLQLMQGAAVLLVTWPPGASQAVVSRMTTQDTSTWVKENHPISVSNEAILTWALQTAGPLPLTVEDLPAETTAWFAAPAGSRLLVSALRTAPTHLVTGVLVLVSAPHRQWASHQLTIFKLLTSQLAWSRRHLHLTALLIQQRQDLEHLNWYKHHCLDEIHRELGKLTQELTSLQAKGVGGASGSFSPLLDRLTMVRQGTEAVLREERWHLQPGYQTMPLISLLNRLLERVNPSLEARQLWSKVHNDSNVILGGDMAKLELVLYEIVLAACNRSPVGGRIDIWCRPLNLEWLELSITDDGQCAPLLLEELRVGHPPDLLAPSKLDELPGLHLAICQTLLGQLGGEITLSLLDDGRTHSRLLLPLATYAEQQKHRSPALSTGAEGDSPSPT